MTPKPVLLGIYPKGASFERTFRELAQDHESQFEAMAIAGFDSFRNRYYALLDEQRTLALVLMAVEQPPAELDELLGLLEKSFPQTPSRILTTTDDPTQQAELLTRVQGRAPILSSWSASELMDWTREQLQRFSQQQLSQTRQQLFQILARSGEDWAHSSDPHLLVQKLLQQATALGETAYIISVETENYRVAGVAARDANQQAFLQQQIQHQHDKLRDTLLDIVREAQESEHTQWYRLVVPANLRGTAQAFLLLENETSRRSFAWPEFEAAQVLTYQLLAALQGFRTPEPAPVIPAHPGAEPPHTSQPGKKGGDDEALPRYLQQSFFTEQQELEQFFPGAFLFSRTVDTIAHDFFWVSEKYYRLYVAVIESRARGMNAGYLTLILNQFLNQAVQEYGILDIDAILYTLNHKLHRVMPPTFEGVGTAICAVDTSSQTLQYAGTGLPVYLQRDSELIRFDSEAKPLGRLTDEFAKFDIQEHMLEEHDGLFLPNTGFRQLFTESISRFATLEDFLEEARTHPFEKQHAHVSQFVEITENLQPIRTDLRLLGINFNDEILV